MRGMQVRGRGTREPVRDAELGVAAVLIGLVVLVTAFVVPLLG